MRLWINLQRSVITDSFTIKESHCTSFKSNEHQNKRFLKDVDLQIYIFVALADLSISSIWLIIFCKKILISRYRITCEDHSRQFINFFLFGSDIHERGQQMPCNKTRSHYMYKVRCLWYTPRVCGMRVNVQFPLDEDMCVHVHCTSTEKFAATMNSMV